MATRNPLAVHGEDDQQRPTEALVTVETQTEFDLFSGRRAERTFLKLYVAARTSGLLAAMSDRDWKTLCTLATYMDADGYCYPSQAELARAMGCSRQMANERIKSLANFQFQGKSVLLVTKEGRTDHGTWARNGYQVMPIANLGIFDDEPSSTDRRKVNQPRWVGEMAPNKPHHDAVSRSLDTAHEPTVSSHTVPVQLDTNKNQETNKNQFDSSNIRKKDDITAEINGNANTGGVTGSGDRCDESRSDGEGEVRQAGDQSLQRQHGSRNAIYDEDRQIILDYLADFSREFGDQAPLKATTTRAYNLYRQAGISREQFIEVLYKARAITKERRATTRQRMPFFFSVVADLLGLNDVRQ